MTISIHVGDITESADEAIVNSANTSLLAGGGVCGAIHAAAGPELEFACRRLGHCPTGEAVVTPAFNLKAKYVIHAVGPRWLDGTRGERELLRRCYESIFIRVAEKGIRSVSIPSISTGIYHYPLESAARVAIDVARQHDAPDLAINFVCFSEEVARAYAKAVGSART